MPTLKMVSISVLPSLVNINSNVSIDNFCSLCTDLPAGLYPTVGLVSKGSIIEVNFGQKPFIFDIQLRGEILFDPL